MTVSHKIGHIIWLLKMTCSFFKRMAIWIVELPEWCKTLTSYHHPNLGGIDCWFHLVLSAIVDNHDWYIIIFWSDYCYQILSLLQYCIHPSRIWLGQHYPISKHFGRYHWDPLRVLMPSITSLWSELWELCLLGHAVLLGVVALNNSAWWFGTWTDYTFFHSVANFIIPTVRGVGFSTCWNHQPEILKDQIKSIDSHMAAMALSP